MHSNKLKAKSKQIDGGSTTDGEKFKLEAE
jgi:hypothetical protein